ncbi:MAG: SH3 domain-containing protein [Phototrophicales bacterium]|mgnify:CR=1 FL=1|nr:SH3 domain-containing protein [Phototrophicales bacterium]
MIKKSVFAMLTLIFGAGLMTSFTSYNYTQAQAPTNTAAPVILPTAQPLMTIGPTLENTPLPTFTPTEPGPVQLEAKESAGPVNVRLEADPESDRLGAIRHGERYVVVGQYFLWYQIRYEQSPTGLGYVFGDLVDIIGDRLLLTDLSLVSPTPQDPEAFNRTATFEAVILTPGGELTLTVAVREILPPSQQTGVVQQGIQATPRPILPTFTYPPNIVAQAPTPNGESSIMTPTVVTPMNTTRTGIAPVTPILVLAGLGFIGLLLSRLFRR